MEREFARPVDDRLNKIYYEIHPTKFAFCRNWQWQLNIYHGLNGGLRRYLFRTEEQAEQYAMLKKLEE
jgi:hypothetical protein